MEGVNRIDRGATRPAEGSGETFRAAACKYVRVEIRPPATGPPAATPAGVRRVDPIRTGGNGLRAGGDEASLEGPRWGRARAGHRPAGRHLGPKR